MAIEYYYNLETAIKENAAYLSLKDCKYKEIPADLFKLKRLKRLEIRGGEFEEIPTDITKLTKLTHLTICDSKLKKLPNELCTMKQLTHLKFENNQLESLPSKIEDLYAVKFLWLKDNQIKKLPIGLSRRSGLQELDLRNNKLSSFFGDISKMVSLRSLNLYENPFTEFPFGIFTVPIKFDLRVDSKFKGALSRKSFSSWDPDPIWDFIKRCQKKALDEQTIRDYFDLAGEFTDRVKKLGQEKLLKALNSKIPIVVLQALRHLLPPNDQEINLTSKDQVLVLVKTALKKTEIKSRLKKVGVGYSNKLDDKTTHVVIGENIKEVDQILDSKCTFISEQHLTKFLDREDAPYILEEKNEIDTEHIKELIMSMNDDSMGVALGLLEGGGVPEEFLTELFIVNRFNGNAKHRSKAKKLLLQKASKSLVDVLKKRKSLNEKLHPHYIQENIKIYADGTELNGIRIAEAMFRKFGTAAGFILTYGSVADRRKILQQLVKDNSLVLKNIRVGSFPEEMLEFSNLQKLGIYCSIGGMYSSTLTKRLDSIAVALTNLEEFAMPTDLFVPENISKLKPLTKLKKLKKLTLYAGKNAEQDIRKMFPDCIVEFSNGGYY